MPLYERDEKGALVPLHGEGMEEALVAIERADEQAILESITRSEAQPWFAYSYPIKTKEGVKDIIGISVDGAKEIARQLGNVKVWSEVKIDEKEGYFYAIVPATDLLRNVTLLGVGRQSKYIIGEGMVPSDRIDETAFVKCIAKGQRNAILSVAPQQLIAQIIERLDTKAIKKLQAPPTYGKLEAPPTKPPVKVGTEEDVLKKLRQQIGIEAGKVFKSDDERKAWQKDNIGVDSMTKMDEAQLKTMLAMIKLIHQPPKQDVTQLGFLSEKEQEDMRRILINLVDELGYKTVEEKRKYVIDKKWKRTTEASKSELESYIEEVNKDKKAIETAESISEEI